MDFQKQKLDCLSKKDKSRKGGIDKPILRLIKKINSSENYYTTSSCSGRIVLLEKKSEKKNEAQWIFKTHYKATFNQIKNALKNIKKNKYEIWLKFEPAIIHIACKAVEDAQKIIDIARAAGFKRSGIQSTRKKITAEIGSSKIIDTIIAKNRRLLISDSYLKELILQANNKLDNNLKKLNKLSTSLF